jgi:hypothetical protein
MPTSGRAGDEGRGPRSTHHPDHIGRIAGGCRTGSEKSAAWFLRIVAEQRGSTRCTEACGEAERPLKSYKLRQEAGDIFVFVDRELVYEFKEEDEVDDDAFFSSG